MAANNLTPDSKSLSVFWEKSLQLGFELIGVTKAQDAPGYKNLVDWLERGYAGSMEYIPRRIDAYQHPRHVLDGCQSVIVLALPYQPNAGTIRPKSISSPSDSADRDVDTTSMVDHRQVMDRSSSESQLASYACGSVDYHDLIWQLLRDLLQTLQEIAPSSSSRAIVDTAPLLERDFATLAGLGWIGKNTLLLNRRIGSYFFLAAILTDALIEENVAFESDHCGTCTACIDACPTQAFPQARVLDASKCISYLTIEHRGLIDEGLSGQMQNWLFGCDVCQMVCPWNRKSQNLIRSELTHTDMERKESLSHWLELDEASFRRLYRKTPFWRTKLEGMQRNALIVAANTGRHDLAEHITRLSESNNEVVRETARRVLRQLELSRNDEG